MAQQALRQKQPETNKQISRRSYKKHINIRRADAAAEYHRRPEYHKARSNKWRKKNLKRVSAWRRKWFAKNPEQRARCNAASVAWAKAHPERNHAACAKYWARKRGALVVSFTIDQWKQLLRVFADTCAYCGRGGPLTQDHLVPISRGGDHSLENIVPACQSCNSSKSDRTPLEWFLWKVA